jgi:hypothetical protein
MCQILVTICFLTPGVLLLLTCGRGEAELKGEVFIVTAGGDSRKLSLVKIIAIPELEIRPFVKNKTSVIGHETATLLGDIDGIRSRIASAQATFNEMKRDYDILNSQKNEIESHRSRLSSEYNSILLSTICDSEYTSPDFVDECRKRRNIAKLLETVDKRLASIAPRVTKAKTTMLEAEDLLNEERMKLQIVDIKVKNYLTPDYLLSGLPEGSLKAVTDSEGKFSMKLPAGKYVLFATATRRVFNVTEDYHWLIWVQVDKSGPGRITLSNQNLLGEDTEEAVFRVRDLLPSNVNQKPEPSIQNLGI